MLQQPPSDGDEQDLNVQMVPNDSIGPHQKEEVEENIMGTEMKQPMHNGSQFDLFGSSNDP